MIVLLLIESASQEQPQLHRNEGGGPPEGDMITLGQFGGEERGEEQGYCDGVGQYVCRSGRPSS